MFFPYRTDAAVESRFWGTVGLVCANVAVALLLGFPESLDTGPDAPLVNSWVLHFGRFNPLTWITSAFVHFGAWHLVVNMISLWVFGIVVESLVGWRRLLLIVLGIAAGGGLITQILMLGAEGGAAGASGVVFGLLAISAIWAPRNHVSIVLFFVYTFEVTVLGWAWFMIGVEIFFFLLGGMRIGSAMLHLIGAGSGLAVGIVCLKRGWVDCGGWDWFSLREKGMPGRRVRHEVGADTTRTDPPAGPERPVDPRVEALVNMRDALDAGNAAAADAAYARGQQAAEGFVIPREELHGLIEALVQAGHAERAIARMDELVRAYPEGSESIQLARAEQLLELNRASQALEQLAALRAGGLTPEQQETRERLERKARARDRDAGLELE